MRCSTGPAPCQRFPTPAACPATCGRSLGRCCARAPRRRAPCRRSAARSPATPSCAWPGIAAWPGCSPAVCARSWSAPPTVGSFPLAATWSCCRSCRCRCGSPGGWSTSKTLTRWSSSGSWRSSTPRSARRHSPIHPLMPAKTRRRTDDPPSTARPIPGSNRSRTGGLDRAPRTAMTPTTGMTIQAHQLTKRYGPVLAVDGLTFEVLPGRVTGFLGPNGAGKSTTMRLVLGLAGLDLVAGRPAGTFSLGMSQRLGVAAALLGDPGVLLLDEPVNGLDPEGVMWIRTLLRSLAREGRTVFVSSHLMSEMAQPADHVIVIGRGRLIADTSVQELVRRGSGGQVRVRSPKADRLAALLRAKGATVEMGADGTMVVRGVDAAAVGELAARHGLALHELVAREASLEEAFMDLTRDAVDYQQQPQKMTRAGRVP